MYFVSDTMLKKLYTVWFYISTLFELKYKHFVNYFCNFDGLQTDNTVLLEYKHHKKGHMLLPGEFPLAASGV